ncbi:MAG: aldehyde dehydrogenase family protein, partial [Candidatus Omnitrophica bacterium]|nr:aldehyde dehydrogenase family protein [Candidatus Omnitrophota bacterium]
MMRKNFIRGQWRSSRGKAFLNINPADTRQILGHYPETTPEELNLAVEAALEAFDTWRLTPVPRRADILMRAGRLMEIHKKRLALIMTREMGKVLKESLGDVQEAIDMAYYTAGEGRRLDGQTLPSELRNKAAMTFRMP